VSQYTAATRLTLSITNHERHWFCERRFPQSSADSSKTSHNSHSTLPPLASGAATSRLSDCVKVYSCRIFQTSMGTRRHTQDGKGAIAPPWKCC